jgi:hypothetical protein
MQMAAPGATIVKTTPHNSDDAKENQYIPHMHNIISRFYQIHYCNENSELLVKRISCSF